MSKSETCPFKAGSRVIYKPTDRGWGYQVMIGIVVPGRAYVVREIRDERYVVVEGYDHPSGGIHWTEFEPAGEHSHNCPFRRGDHVVYEPSERGCGAEVTGQTLVPGRTYVVRGVRDGAYVLVEGGAPSRRRPFLGGIRAG